MNREYRAVAFLFAVAILIVVAVAFVTRHDREDCEKAGGEYKYNYAWKHYKCEKN